MNPAHTKMRREIEEIPAAVDRLVAEAGPRLHDFARQFTGTPRANLATIARGTSDHAANYLKYAFEITLGLPTASLGPSIASIYDAPMKMDRTVALAISQSGQSPDIVSMAEKSRECGALTLCFVNDIQSPLAAACDTAIDLCAGPEYSVAATKTFVSSVVAGLLLLAELTDDRHLRQAIVQLPGSLENALEMDWTVLSDAICAESSMFVLGRGPALAIAGEAALKLKETCGLHAEAFSGAEVMHGPVELVDRAFPVLIFAPPDAAENNMAQVAEKLAASGAVVFATTAKSESAHSLAVPQSGHPLVDALLPIVPFYAFVEQHARRLGRDPDQPVRLRKVTETV